MKKKVPLSVLQVLNKFTQDNSEIVEPLFETEHLLHLVDTDENSDFFYTIKKSEVKDGKLVYLVSYKPQNSENINSVEGWLQIRAVENTVYEWLENIKEYNKYSPVFDNAIYKIYKNEFIKKFDIVEEDASYSPFNMEQQLILDDYLNTSLVKVLELKKGKNDKEVKELEQVESDIKKIKNNLTKEPKRKIVRRLSGFWAKAQLIGLDVFKELFINISSELIKKLMLGQ